MKVLVTIPCLLTGGTETQTLHLVRALVSMKYSVAVVCYFEYDKNVIRLFEESGVDVILLNENKDGRPRGVRLVIQLHGQLRTVFNKFNPDVVHVQYMAPGLLPIMIAKSSGIKKIIATVHQTADAYNAKHRMMLRTGAGLSSRFVSVSQAAGTSWFGTNARNKKYRTISNTIDEQSLEAILHNGYTKIIREKYNLNEKIVVGVVSRLRYEKGVDIFIESLEDVLKAESSAMCLIVGDGPERMNLYRLGERKSINGKIVWTGSKHYEDAMKLLCCMDIVVCPSRTEGFGLTVLEAMYCGKPVIASRTGGLPEVVEDNHSGLLFESGNTQDLSEKLLKLIRDPDLRTGMGKNARQRAIDEFSFDIFTQRIKELYEEVLAE